MAGEADIWQPRTILELSPDTKRITQKFTATSGQALYTITDFAYSLGTGSLQIFKNGSYQAPGIDWVENTITTFSLVSPASAGDIIVAVGYAGITGTVDVRDTDIFLANYQAVRDYVGTEVTAYVQGTTLSGDGGQSFFQKFTGAAIGFYVDDNNDILLPTGGDGTIGWVRSQLIASDFASATVGKGASLIKFESGNTLEDLDDVATDTGAKGFHLVNIPPFSGEANVSKYEYNRFTPRRYGAIADGTTDDTVAIQAAIAAAYLMSGMTVIDLEGLVYGVTANVNIKSNTILANGKLIYSGTTVDEAVVSMGDPDGGDVPLDTIVRPGGCENVRVKVTSTTNGITGFRFDTLVRSSWFKGCYAEMNEDTPSTRGQKGFEIVSTTILNATFSVGCYENLIHGCTAYNAKHGYMIRTRGTDAEAKVDPQANANYILTCFAYACKTSAVTLYHGAQDNIIDIRADNFVSQIGLGTTINVVDCEGNYNQIKIQEELGVKADTQYVVRYGADSAYNHTKFHTQGIGTGVVDDSAITGVSKNIVEQIGLGGLSSTGGQMMSVHHYTADVIPLSVTQEVRDVWIAPKKCIVTRCVAKLTANTTTTVQCYFAKNAVYSTSNRIEFTSGQGTTFENIITDPTAAGAIDAQWELEEGDSIYMAVTNGAGETNRALMSFLVKFVE